MSNGILEHCRHLVASERWREARPLLERMVDAGGAPDGVLRQLAELEILDGAPARALERLAARCVPRDTEDEFLMARAEEALGELEAARARLEALRPRLTQPSAPLEALLATIHGRRGDHEAARAALERSLALNPADAGLHLRHAQVCSLLADAPATVASLERAAAAGPATAQEWLAIGALEAEHWRFEAADRALARAADLDPGAPRIESLWSLVKQELGDAPGALQALARAARRAPDDLETALSQRLFLPPVYSDAQDAGRWRERYAAGIAAIGSETQRWLLAAPAVFDLARNNFLLAYQGEDDRELQQGYSRFLATLAGAAHPEWRAGRPIRFDGTRRLKVGFVGNLFRDCTAGRYFERWATGLDAGRFERFVYHTAAVSDAFTGRIAAAVEHFSVMRASGRDAAAALFDAQLDVIVYPEVGMTPLSYLLAALRLAPVQCAGWGHPVTTGSDAIDRYFTCAAMEPADAAGHYVERLARLPGLGVDYAMPEVLPPFPRAQLGVSAEQHLYACPQSLFKVHPEMDALFADIVAGDAGAVLLFFQAPARAVTAQFAARLERVLAERGVRPGRQVKFLPRLAGADFRRVLGAADVILDTVRWSGGNTTLDALAAGAPVVTLPGRFMRARQSAAMLGMLGLDDLVTATPREYVRTALDLARDADRNACVRTAIAQRRAALFGQRSSVEAFAETLLNAAAGRS